MPPKVKFSKETMIGTALQLVREKGMASFDGWGISRETGSYTKSHFWAIC